MGAIRKAVMSIGLTVFGLGLAFAIMTYDMPHVDPGLSDLRAFDGEKAARRARPESTSLRKIRDCNATLPVEAQGPSPSIGGGGRLTVSLICSR